MAPPRILLCGDVRGRLNQLVKRVQSVNKSAGPFDVVLCVGQFFPDSPDRFEEFTDYIEGRARIPLPTYFIGDYGIGAAKVLLGASKDSGNRGFKMDGLKICENLFWLKGSGKFNLHGLAVAYLSGRQSSESQRFGTYSQDDVDVLRALAEEPVIIDLFLTNEWPSGIENGASGADIPANISDSAGSDSTISQLAAEIKPRYHVAGSKGVYYAREPYLNVDALHVTRFLGLASVGNKEKQKFIHALSPTPSSTVSAAEISLKPPNTTLTPYSLAVQKDYSGESTKRSSDTVSDSQYWRYDVSRKRQRHDDGNSEKLCLKFVYTGSCPRGEKCNFRHELDAREQFLRGVCLYFIIKGKCEKGPDCSFKHSYQSEDTSDSHRRPGSGNASGNRSKQCWFCLSSPNVGTHLIVTIGENFYCALPKGPLIEDHVLIIPVEHLPNTLSLASEGENELAKFQNSLEAYFKNCGKAPVFFEWVSKHSSHANIQAVPVPSSKAALLTRIFNMASEKLGFKFLTKKFESRNDGRRWLQTQYDKNMSCFYIELPEGTVLFHLVEENENFPAQFGREVLAGLLNLADRADWRSCKLSKAEEENMVEEFKKRFEVFYPSQ